MVVNTLTYNFITDENPKNAKITDSKISETQSKEDPVQTYLIIAGNINTELTVNSQLLIFSKSQK